MGTQQSMPPEPQRGVTDEDLLYASQDAHYHCTSQAIRFPGDLDEGERTRVKQQFDSGGFEPAPIEVVTRNRQSDAVRVRSRWDGTQLHLDICPTQAPTMALRPAVLAMARFYADQKVKLAALVLTVAIVLAAVIAALLGVV